MKKYSIRAGALLLALAVCASLLPAASAEARTVAVSDARELMALAEHCRMDGWSEGLIVELTADIDLLGTGFTPIPVFRGTFRGNGHTISGFSFSGRGSDQGLFRYLRPGAVVEDLTVEGRVAPGGSRSALGLLCGQNGGTISRCTVSGAVAGETDVGGVAGVNLEGGVISGCKNLCAVTGSTHTGGIAGRNEGAIRGCVNQGAVNTQPTAPAPQEEDASSTLLEGAASQLDEAFTDTGGIAGRSTGEIRGCENHGEVGYPHTGYNAGGIAGRQSGSVLDCGNYGSIQGRKDVGGIVGQFEPYTELFYGEDPMQRLDEALGTLSSLLGTLTDQVSQSAGDAADDLAAVNNALSAIRDTAHGAVTEGREDAGAAVDAVYASAQDVNGALDALLGDLDTFSAAANADLDEIIAQLGKFRDGVGQALNTLDWAAYNVADEIDLNVSVIQTQVEDVIRPSIQAIGDDLGNLVEFVRQVSEIVRSGADPDQMLEDLRAAAGLLEGIDFQGHIGAINGAVGRINGAVRNLSRDLKLILGDASDDLEDSLNDADRAAKALERAADALNGDAKAFSDALTGDLRTVNQGMDAIEDVLKDYGDTLGGKTQDTADQVNAQLEIIGERLDRFTDGARQANDTLHGTTTAVIRQFDAVRDAITALGQEPERTVDDQSGGELDQGPGLVISCANAGAVAGDSNVGGVAGIVAPEISLDPERDLDLSEHQLLVDTTAVIRATLRACANTGAVCAKNDCAGGIAGRAEVGAVISCVNTSGVETTTGGRCGGIAGLSRSVIRGCQSLSDLTGRDGLGGIAGEGRDIADCRAMARILGDGGEKLGAIAGSADGALSGNCYLDEGLGAVDGIDYAGMAYPLDYGAFSVLEGLPEAFTTFRVTFQADGAVVGTLDAPYGGALDPASFPRVPERDGVYGQWEDFDYRTITRSVTVHAVYSGWITTISSGGEHPAALAEGNFSPAAVLTLEDWRDAGQALPAGYEALCAYTYAVTDGEPLPDQITLRVQDMGEGSRLALLRNGTLTPVDAERDGSYLVFTTGTQGAFAVVRKTRPSTPLVLGLCGGGAALVLLAALLLRRRGRKKAAPKPAAAAK